MTPIVFTALALAAAAVSAVTDANTGRIPNAVTFPAAALGVALHWPGGFGSLSESALGLLLAGGFPFVLHRVTGSRAIGGGDVKLFAALGAILGPVTGLEIELSSFVVLAVFALVRLAVAGKLLRVLASAGRLLANPFLPERLRRPVVSEALTEMRLGPAIFCAAVTVTFADQLAVRLPWLA